MLTLAMAITIIRYTGGVQHFVYNVLFRRLFGSGRHAVGFALARTVLLKTAVDMGIHVSLLITRETNTSMFVLSRLFT